MKRNVMKQRFFLPARPLGALTLIISFTMPTIPAAEGVESPIIALEFARSAADVEQVLAGRRDIIAAMVQSVRQDRIFILAYSAFLMVSCLLAWRRWRKGIVLAGLGLGLAAAIFDYLENGALMAILEGTPALWPAALSDLTVYTYIKWGAITGVFLLLGTFIRAVNVLGKLIFGLSIGATVFLLGSLFAPQLSLAFAMLIALLFLLWWIWMIFER